MTNSPCYKVLLKKSILKYIVDCMCFILSLFNELHIVGHQLSPNNNSSLGRTRVGAGAFAYICQRIKILTPESESDAE